jgi:tRNA pseudouridine55 synthase
MENILAVYKPKGPTSHDIIDEIRRETGVKKVGHAGTLDPLAKGILVVGIGRAATKQLGALGSGEKEYLATIELGAVSKTDDSEGPIEAREVSSQPNIAKVKKLLTSLVGEIEQRPPAYSAVHVNGTKSYRLARQQGLISPLPPREVFVKNIKLIKYHWPILKLKIITGPGVYIRSIARDIGERLGVGGYLKELERTRVDGFTIDKAFKINRLPKYKKSGG